MDDLPGNHLQHDEKKYKRPDWQTGWFLFAS